MINDNDPKRNKHERRKDAPSGRQTATHPEHSRKIDQAASSLHQGQGPDFQTQDSHLQQRNPGVRNLRKGSTLPTSEPEDVQRVNRHEGSDQNDRSKSRRDDTAKEG